MEVEGNISQEVSTGKRRRRRKPSVTFRRKYSWKTSSSVSEAVDSDKETLHCEKSLDEAHVCSEADGFSESTPGLDSESSDSETEEVKVVKKRRKKRRFLTHRKTYSAKSVGNLEIVSRDEGDAKGGDVSSDDVSLSGLEESDLDVLLDILPTNDGSRKQRNTEEPAVIEHRQDSAPSLISGEFALESDDPASPVLSTTIQSLEENMMLLLSDGWTVNTLDGHILRVLKISTNKNAFIDFSVYYDAADKTIGVFVHGVPVSPENRVFKCKNVPDSDNVGSVSDFLCELIKRIELMKVCSGISEHEHLWSMSRGFLDYSTPSSPCYRRGSCHLLIKQNSERCQKCQEEINRIERKVRKEQKSDFDSTPDSYLSSESVREKKNHYRKMYRRERQRANRLERRLANVQIKLDAALKDELTSILHVNQQKMTKLQRLFWEQQRRALSLNDSRGMRWHPMLIRVALHLHSLSDSAYSFLGESKMLILPSKRRLYDYSHFVEHQEGCQEDFLHHIREKVRKCGEEEHFSFVNLMFDEMNIRSGLVIKRSTGELIGYTKLSDCEEELKKMQDEIDSRTYKPQLAKKILVYLVNGITSNVKDVVAVYSTDVLSAAQLYDRTWDVIYNLEDAGIKVLSVTCDGASVNRKFFFMHESLDKQVKYTYCTKNLAAGSRPLFFVLDPPHLLKTIRNALGNSFSHKRTRKLWKNNEYLSWKVIEQLYKITEGNKFRTHKLTKAHIKLTSFSCMTVLYATQVLSNSVANSIEDLAGHKKMEMFQTSELVKFIRLMNKFFDCVNGKGETTEKEKERQTEEKEAGTASGGREREGEEGTEAEEQERNNLDKAPYLKLDDARFHFLQQEFLNFFVDWKKDIQNRPGIFSDAEKSRMIISHQGLGALEITVHGIVGAIRFMLSAGAPSVGARAFNQDPLEQYFSKVRRAQGDSNNPFLKSVHDIRLNLHAQGLVASPSQKGNTDAQKRKEVDIDSSPLPARKIKRK